MTKKTTYEVSKGLVYGEYWSGGEGAYTVNTEARLCKADTLEELKEKLESMKSIDGGMGFENELGGYFFVSVIETIEIDGVDYTADRETVDLITGTLNDKQTTFLQDAMYSD